MKTLEQYKCDVCGTVYADKRKCEACETGHKKPMKITDRKYEPIGIETTGFPSKIAVETQDGEKAIYDFCTKLIKCY